MLPIFCMIKSEKNTAFTYYEHTGMHIIMRRYVNYLPCDKQNILCIFF